MFFILRPGMVELANEILALVGAVKVGGGGQPTNNRGLDLNSFSTTFTVSRTLCRIVVGLGRSDISHHATRRG